MIVIKFGGSSITTPKNMLKVKDIIIRYDEPLVVIVSAFGGCTAQLQELAAHALDGDYKKIFTQFKDRHLNAIKALIPRARQKEVLAVSMDYLNELEYFCSGISLIKELSDRSKAKVLSFGELLSAFILTEVLREHSIKARFVDSRKIIITDESYLFGKVDFGITNQLIEKSINKRNTYVLPGFIASTKEGKTTTLGFGGSDYTAAILASALDARRLEIWSDVDGMLTGNPNMIKEAATIPELSYNEALELSHFGAKVLFPMAIQPVLNKKIPLLLKNTFRPDKTGTRIFDKIADGNKNYVVGISGLSNITLLTVSGVGMMGISGYSEKVFGALSQAKINVVLISQSCSEYTICIGILSFDRKKAVAAINKAFVYEISRGLINTVQHEDNLSIVALVGDKMKYQPGISGKAFSALGENGVNVKAIAQGSSERNISIVVDEVNEKKAINVLHEGFFTEARKTIHLFVIGTGNVGKEFLQILQGQYSFMKNDERIEFKLAGIANSRKMLLDDEGIALENCESLLSHAGLKTDLARFVRTMKTFNLRNSIFIDITASPNVAGLYEQVLEASVSIVTCNKIAPGDTYARYAGLKRLAKKRNMQLRYETCVGAALPVINTINDLIVSGDRIEKIEAVLSGSLNFIFNNYDTSHTFSEVVQMARDEGLTEPDPLIDLNGVDVIRKILILSREAGYKIELEDVAFESILPANFGEKKKMDLMAELEKYEEHFKSIYTKSAEKGKKLRFVASLNHGKAAIGLQEISMDHPFYNIEGKDNIVAINTSRYSGQPLVIKGPGAGAEITASGIFSDVMRIVNNGIK